MRGLLRASAAFTCGTIFFFAALFAVKVALVSWIGDGLYKLPDLQLERFGILIRQRPATTSPLVILGDSTATFSVSATNFSDATAFAIVNSTTIENYYLLKRLLNSGAAPKCVLASFSFVWNLNRTYFWTMFGGGKYYDKEELSEIVRVSKGFGEEPGARSPFYRELRRLSASVGFWDDVNVPRLQNGVASIDWDWRRVRLFRNSLWQNRGSTPLADASRFDGSLSPVYEQEPWITRTEAEYFRRLLVLLASRGITLFFYEVPFADGVAPEAAVGYWSKVHDILSQFRETGARVERVGGGFVPAAEVISAGHLNAAGIQRMAPVLRKATEGCYR